MSEHMWVVELQMRTGQWEPTVGVGISRDHGNAELRDWRKLLPDDKLRLRKYVRKEP